MSGENSSSAKESREKKPGNLDIAEVLRNGGADTLGRQLRLTLSLSLPYADGTIEESPPSHTGSRPDMPHPTNPKATATMPTENIAWPTIRRALSSLSAPIKCAAWTEKPATIAEPIPQKSHVVVDTIPIDAEASAPRLPTIEW